MRWTPPASTLLLPIWSQPRELDAKLLLACAAAERGIETALGSRAHIGYHAHRIPRGVYLAKGGYREGNLFRIMRWLGHEIVVLDEASLLRMRDDEVRARRFKPKAARRVARYFAWGEDDARLLGGTPQCSDKPIQITGNPRIDMTRPELRAYYDDEAAVLRARHGTFVLLNTNFSPLNHFMPALSVDLAVARGEAKATDYYRALAAHRLRLFDALRELVPRLARALGDVTLVVRPHPFESPIPWIEAGGGARNLVVSQEGNIHPWLHAAEAVVANGCTSLIEAHLLGRPSISFEPFVDPELDDPLPQSVSHRCRDDAELFELVKRSLRGELQPRDDDSKRLRHHLSALSGRLACDRIVDALEEAGYARAAPPASNPALRVAAIVQSVARRRQKLAEGESSRHGERLHSHRFPALQAVDLERRISRLTKLTGRFSETRVELIWPHVFRVSRG